MKGPGFSGTVVDITSLEVLYPGRYLLDFEIEKFGFLQKGKQVLNQPDDKFDGSLQGESRPHRRMK
jgi:hypothetical protein